MIRLALLLALWCSHAFAQTAEPAPILRIEPLPRLLHCWNDGPACRINAALFAVDQDILRTVADCGTIPAEDQTEFPPATTTEQIYWDRRVQVTMNGPSFLAILVTDDASCPGAAHGFTQVTPLLYDLTTGAEVDPLSWLPADLAPGSPAKPAIDRNDALTQFYTESSDPNSQGYPVEDCHQILRDIPHGFVIWPDAAQHSLVLQPSGLPFRFTGCAFPASIPLDKLRARHFATALLAALAQS